MAKLLVVGDIHNSWTLLEEVIAPYNDTHKIIFTGDYFDSFGDSPVVARQTALWLKESLQKPNRVHIIGNHDINYSYKNFINSPTAGIQTIYNCSGYTMLKDAAINEVMTEDDWDRIKLHHFENGWIFTHAGVSGHWFEHPVLGTTLDIIEQKIKQAQEDFDNRVWSDILGAAGRCRGGTHKAGGILWHDHYREASPLRDIKQVYGHTPTSNGINIFEENGGINIDVDCGLTELLEINEDGTYGVIVTGAENFYDEQHRKLEELKREKYRKCVGSYDHVYEKL